MGLKLYSESDIMRRLSAAMKNRRISLSLTQKEAAQRAGLSTIAIQKFENSGIISFRSLASLLIAYGMEDKFLSMIEDRDWWTLDQLKNIQNRQRIKHGRSG
jgi:transcriptional regulator with XRE-family HTH domain